MREVRVIDRPISDIIGTARSTGRRVLFDPEGFAVLRQLGIAIPVHRFVRHARDLDGIDFDAIPGDRVVLKVVTSHTLHKTDIGGVQAVSKEPAAVEAAIRHMENAFVRHRVEGYTVNEYVPHDESIGSQFLLGARWTDDFGPVITVAPGGVQAEFLADNLKAESAIALFTPALDLSIQLDATWIQKPAIRLATQRYRGGGARVLLADLSALVAKFADFAARFMPHDVVEFEVNPLVQGSQGPVALDVLVKLGDGRKPCRTPRPLAKLRQLLEPESIAVVGVSEARNVGRIILENVIASGFPVDRLYVVKPDTDSVAGVRCFPDIESLPGRVDLIVLGLAADKVPDLMQRLIAARKADSVIVVAGGLGERTGTEGCAAAVTAAIRRARQSDWRGPVLNGGNSLGIRSVPGRYDATFLPRHKLLAEKGSSTPLALISQSGALAATVITKLAKLNARYMISIGNQTDLTVGDYLSYLKDDPEVKVFACYVEGFQPGDGEKWLTAAAQIAAGGRSVILYRAGRTVAGATASASHTASISGSYLVTRELAHSAGVIVANTLADFADLTKLACQLQDRHVGGWRLGAVSNAGFECVAIADNVGQFDLQRLDTGTTNQLERLFRSCGVDGVVEVHNPVDLTPIMDDATFEAAARTILEADNIDVGIIGCVPLTGALSTLAPNGGHSEDVFAEHSIARRLAGLRQTVSKPWVAVVDAGSIYDPMASVLEESQIPTFRTADRALRVFEQYCRNKLESWDHGLPR